MIPTMCGSGSVVLQEHISPRFGSIRDGDVVIARPPYNKDITVCKRVRATVRTPRLTQPNSWLRLCFPFLVNAQSSLRVVQFPSPFPDTSLSLFL